MPDGDDADLLIFAVGLCRSSDRPVTARCRLGHHERVTEAAVEAAGEIASQLEMLALVLADGHLVRLVEQDVGGLQHRIGEQADRRTVAALPLRLVLELRHPSWLRRNR